MCPNVCFERLQPSQSCSKWCTIGDDPDFNDFWGPKFTSFSVERSGGKYFGKSIVGALHLNIVPATVFLCYVISGELKSLLLLEFA